MLYGHGHLGNQIRDVRADGLRAHQRVRRFVDHHFHHPLALVDCQRLAEGAEGEGPCCTSMPDARAAASCMPTAATSGAVYSAVGMAR